MFGKRKNSDSLLNDDEYEEVSSDDVNDDDIDVGDIENIDLRSIKGVQVEDEDADGKKSIKQRYININRLFKKHLIYTRMVSLSAATLVLGVSIAGGIYSGLQTQGAKAKEVSAPGTELAFSKTGATMTVGTAMRSGHNILIPLFSDGTSPIDPSAKPSTDGGSFDSATGNVSFPSYSGGSVTGSFIPISATNYRMYISALDGKVNASTQARYVKFGATGLGAIVLSNVSADSTVRVLLENKKVYKVPGASSPGLTVDGRPVNTDRDVMLINTNLATTKVAKTKFNVDSKADTLLSVIYTDNARTLLSKDRKTLAKLLKVNEQKLKELQANRDSLNAGHVDTDSDSESSENPAPTASSGSTVPDESIIKFESSEDASSTPVSNDDETTNADSAIAAQQSIIDNNKEDQTELDAFEQKLNDYVANVASHMTESAEYSLAK